MPPVGSDLRAKGRMAENGGLAGRAEETTVGTLPFPTERASCNGLLGPRNDRRLPDRRRGWRAALRRTAFARGRRAGGAGDKRLGQPRHRLDPHRGHSPDYQGPRCTRYGGPRSREDGGARGDGGVGRLWARSLTQDDSWAP